MTSGNGEHQAIMRALDLMRAENREDHADLTARLNQLDRNLSVTNTAAHGLGTRMAVLETTCASRGKTISNLNNRAVSLEKQVASVTTSGARIGAIWSTLRIVAAVAAWAVATLIAVFIAR